MDSVTIELPLDQIEFVQEFAERNCPDLTWQDVLSLWVGKMIQDRRRSLDEARSSEVTR